MKKFSYEVNGYNKEEVNRFLEETIVQMEHLLNKTQKQESLLQEKEESLKRVTTRFNSLNEELGYYRQIEETLKRAIYSAEEASNNIKQMASKEASLIVQDAKQNASRLVGEALLRAEKIENKTNLIEKNLRVFKNKFKLIVEQQLSVVDEIDDLELD